MQDSKLAFARFLGITHGKMQKWEKGQWPSAEDIENIELKLGFNLRWLVTGEGDPEGTDLQQTMPPPEVKPAPTSIMTSPVPVVGLASCGVEGIEQIMPYNITASPIALGPRAVAVVASGESMVPAGIASGHLCFCDPDQIALPGEAVFLRLRDDKGALKLFLGEGARVGYTQFRGWLAERDCQGHQKSFILEQLTSQIDYIAPVIFIRRRL